MAEYKPKHDDQLAGDAKANMPHPSKPAKAHGDKLKEATEEAAKKPAEKH
jgi:hypothetical protein